MAKVKIDGTEYDIPVMKFSQLKRAYPIVQEIEEETDPMKLMAAAIRVVSIAATRKFPDLTPEFIEENLDVNEAKALMTTMTDLMKDAGLITEASGSSMSGEAQGVHPEPPSTETSTPSSPNSSPPDAPEEIGTPLKSDGALPNTI